MTSLSSPSDGAETACEARFLARAKYADERASGPGDSEQDLPPLAVFF